MAGEGKPPGGAADGGGDFKQVAGAEVFHSADAADQRAGVVARFQADQVGEVELVLLRRGHVIARDK